MNKEEQKFIDALEERFYKVGSFIDGNVFDPFVYKNDEGIVVEAIDLTLDEAKKVVRFARLKKADRYYHIFNKENKWTDSHDTPGTRNIRHLIR